MKRIRSTTTSGGEGKRPLIALGALPRWRKILSLVLLVGILATMTMIFLFSAEDKEASGDRSGGVTDAVATVIVPGYTAMTPEEKQPVREQLHHPVRKLAHFSEFGLLAVLCGGLWTTATTRGQKEYLRWVIPAGFCLLYAASDELHQAFTGRGPALKDVLIDFSGSLTGLCLLYGVLALVHMGLHRNDCPDAST